MCSFNDTLLRSNFSLILSNTLNRVNPTVINNIVAYVVQLETKLLQGLNQAIMDYVQIISHGRRCLDP